MGHHSCPARVKVGSDDNQSIPLLTPCEGTDAIHFIHGVPNVGLDPENVEGGNSITLQ